MGTGHLNCSAAIIFPQYVQHIHNQVYELSCTCNITLLMLERRLPYQCLQSEILPQVYCQLLAFVSLPPGYHEQMLVRMLLDTSGGAALESLVDHKTHSTVKFCWGASHAIGIAIYCPELPGYACTCT